jgi:large subunit ribosomal protein L36
MTPVVTQHTRLFSFGHATTRTLALHSPAPMASAVTTIIPTRTFKVRSAIKKLCEHCYVRRKKNKKWYVYCKANPRHKQRQF